MPEATTLARQMGEALTGRTVTGFARGPLTHKFLWLNRPDGEIQEMLQGRAVTGADSFGRSIYLRLGEAMLWWGDAGGTILLHAPGVELPRRHHLRWDLDDGSHLTFTLQMWAAVKVLDRSQFEERPKEESGLDPLSRAFTPDALSAMLDAYPEKTSKGVKGFLVATGYAAPQHINGLGNAYVQDILFHAGLDPRRKVMAIDREARRRLFQAIQATLTEAIRLGGRAEERDLYGRPGGYHRRMDSRTVGQPCPQCRSPIQKIAYLGGSCYLCPVCQT